jgi:outer membrane protein assembly factor BamB
MPWFRSLCALALTAAAVAAADRPQWLGPKRDGASAETVNPWKEAPKVLWRQPLGEGHSAPVVVDGKVFLHARVKDKNEEEVVALDAKTGNKLWSKSYARTDFKSPFGAGPRATPAVVDGKVYTLGVTGILSCFDAKDGAQRWQVDTLKKFNAKNLTFGVSTSPIVTDGKVMVNVGGPGASVVAFDSTKGDVVWKSLDDPASYSSPIVSGKHVIFLTAQGLVALQSADGTPVWKFPLVDLLSESSTTPVRIGDLFLGSSVTYGSVAVDPRKMKATKPPQPAQVWKNAALTCYFSTPVVVPGERLYMVTGTLLPPPQATLRCVDATTGKELWSRPKVGKYHASLLRTGNDKLLMLDDAGNLMLLEPDAKEYKELARAKVCGPTWVHPALSDGRLYVRDNDEVMCLQMPQ